MENKIKNFKLDKKNRHSYELSKNILKNINLLTKSKNSQKIITEFSEIFNIPFNTLNIKFKRLVYNTFDYKTGKFNKKISFLNIFPELLKFMGIFILIILSKNKIKIKNYDFILHGVQNQRSFERYKALLLKYKKSLVFSEKNIQFKSKKISLIKISNFKLVSSNCIKNKRITLVNIFFKILYISLYSQFNYIYFFNLILFSILKNFTLFEESRGKFFMEDRFYNTCSIRNFFFKKFDGYKTCTPQKNILETCISFFIDIDIFFSLAKEQYSKARIKSFGGRVENVLPAGSFFMEHDWYRKKKDLDKVPQNDVLIMGLNPNSWLQINNLNKKNYEYTIRNWVRKISQIYPSISITIKHHSNLVENNYERKFFENSKVKTVIKGPSKNGSYGYLKKSKVIFSFGSTSTLEAISMDKQSYFMDPGLQSKNFFYGMKNLDKIRVKSFKEFKKKIDYVVFKKKGSKYNKNNFCLNSNNVSKRVFEHLKKS